MDYGSHILVLEDIWWVEGEEGTVDIWVLFSAEPDPVVLVLTLVLVLLSGAVLEKYAGGGGGGGGVLLHRKQPYLPPPIPLWILCTEL